MKAICYTLKLMTNVIIPDVVTGDPNTLTSQWYIPGSVIRGVAISRYLANEENKQTGDEELRKLFFTSDLRFLHAYPSVGADQKRALPTPLSWRSTKDDEGTIYNLAVSDPGITDAKLERVKAPFCYLEEGIYKVEVDDWLSIHIKRSRAGGATDDESRLFKYHSIEAGQEFFGSILSENEEYLAAVQCLITAQPDLYIGKSHKIQYGHVQCTQIGLVENYREYSGTHNQESIIVTLLSDTLIRHPQTGAYQSDLADVIPAIPQQVFAEMKPIGGYNRKWNLPLPVVQAIKAGSVFVYDYDEKLWEQLQILEQKGIGERTNEGYGRISINWHFYDKKKVIPLQPPMPAQDTNLQKTDNADAAEKLVRKIFSQRCDEKLIESINEYSVTKGITKTQLSRLSTQIRHTLINKTGQSDQKNGIEELKEFIDAMRPTAKKQYQDAKIKGKPLLQWIMSLLDQPQTIWSILKIEEANYPTIGDVTLSDQTLQELSVQYTARFIDGVLRMAVKERGQ